LSSDELEDYRSDIHIANSRLSLVKVGVGRSRITQNHGKNERSQNMVHNGFNVNSFRKNDIHYLETLGGRVMDNSKPQLKLTKSKHGTNWI
jgi:hypothetical protein